MARKQTVAVAEATSGGLITGKLLLLRTELSLQPYFRILHHLTFIVSDPKASLMGRSRASRFYKGSITVYTRVAGRELLPKDVRHKVFVKDYADPSFDHNSYRESKITFVLNMANHVRNRFEATYGIAESGATEANGLGKKLRPAGAFTAVAVVGPNNYQRVAIFDSEESNDRRGNMKSFAAACLRNFKDALGHEKISKL